MKIQTSTVYGILAITAVVGLVAGCAGFDMGDVVSVPIPLEIQRDKGLGERISLNASHKQYLAWADEMKRVDAEWRAANDQGETIAGALGQIGQDQLNTLGPTLAGIPVVGPGVVGLAGVAGLFFGTARTRREKEDSYNAGLKKGAEAIAAAKTG